MANIDVLADMQRKYNLFILDKDMDRFIEFIQMFPQIEYIHDTIYTVGTQVHICVSLNAKDLLCAKLAFDVVVIDDDIE